MVPYLLDYLTIFQGLIDHHVDSYQGEFRRLFAGMQGTQIRSFLALVNVMNVDINGVDVDVSC